MAAAHDPVRLLSEEIAVCVAERQSLRATQADAEALERNRLAICALQQRLAEALIAHYLPSAAEAA